MAAVVMMTLMGMSRLPHSSTSHLLRCGLAVCSPETVCIQQKKCKEQLHLLNGMDEKFFALIRYSGIKLAPPSSAAEWDGRRKTCNPAESHGAPFAEPVTKLWGLEHSICCWMIKCPLIRRCET